MIIRIVLLLIVLGGAAVTCVSAWYLVQDWAALGRAFARLEAALRGSDALAIQKAAAFDQVYRLNCFADGVGALLGAILAAIGLHGLCGSGTGHRIRTNAGGEARPDS